MAYDSPDDDEISSISSPIYSPISASSNTSLSDYNETSFIVQDLEEAQEKIESLAVAPEIVPNTGIPSLLVSETASDDDLCPATLNGFKIVGDNIDKNVRPSFQRSDQQTKSFHHFHACAVRDRVDFSSLSDVERSSEKVDINSFLMTNLDWEAFKDTCAILISRYL